MDIVTDAMTAFKMTEADKFCDILAVASSATNTSVDQMGEAFKYCAPVCGGLGISAKDTAVFLGTLANQSIKGSQAGTTLRKGLQNLAKPTKEMTTQMKKYGILELFKGKNKKYRGTIYEGIRVHTDDLVSARVFLCCFHDHHGL